MAESAQKTIEDLVRAPLDVEGLDDDATWFGYVRELQSRGDRATWDAMCGLCPSPAAPERILAIDVLGELGFAHDKPFSAETAPVLIEAQTERCVWQSMAAILAVSISLACGSDDQVTKDDLRPWLADAHDAGLQPGDPDCVDDEMWNAGLSQADLRALLKVDSGTGDPEGEFSPWMDAYVGARRACP